MLLWLAGLALRVTILALPPVFHAVTAEFHLRAFDIGLLTAIPSLCFSVVAVPGATLIARLGAVRALLTGLVLNAFGAAGRAFTGDVVGLELTTSLMCLGVAVMQPALPTLVRMWTPKRVGLATATYTCGLLCGEVLPVLWPLGSHLLPISQEWRATVFLWSLPVVATAMLTAKLHPRVRDNQIGTAHRWPKWREASLWKVALLLGAVNAVYFGLNGFLPDWLSQAGRTDLIGTTLLTLNVAQLPAAFLMMAFIDRFVFRRVSYLVGGVLMLGGSLGLAMAPPNFASAFAAMAGFALAWLLTLALALPPLVVDEERLPKFSAVVFTVSYAIAVLTALLTGVLGTTGADRVESIVPIAAAALMALSIGATIRRKSA